jgi:hypothetical protein
VFLYFQKRRLFLVVGCIMFLTFTTADRDRAEAKRRRRLPPKGEEQQAPGFIGFYPHQNVDVLSARHVHRSTSRCSPLSWRQPALTNA